MTTSFNSSGICVFDIVLALQQLTRYDLID